MSKKRILHAGCGHSCLPAYFGEFEEVRLDLDPACKPDILASMADIPADIGLFNGVYTCHALEHLAPYDVLPCLEGFRRVLKPDGAVIVIVPDLEGIEPTDEVVYTAIDGGGNAVPVTGLDMIYGHSLYLKDMPYMAHRCGFVSKMLEKVMYAAGFKKVVVSRQSNDCMFRSLVAIGSG